MTPLASYLVETGVTLLAVVALAVLILYGARRLGVGRPVGPMQLLGRLPLDARRALYLVKVGERVLVLGVSEAGLTRLAQMRADQLPPALEAPGPRFTDVVARLRGRAPRSTQAAPGTPPPGDGVDAEDNS